MNIDQQKCVCKLQGGGANKGLPHRASQPVTGDLSWQRDPVGVIRDLEVGGDPGYPAGPSVIEGSSQRKAVRVGGCVVKAAEVGVRRFLERLQARVWAPLETGKDKRGVLPRASWGTSP